MGATVEVGVLPCDIAVWTTRSATAAGSVFGVSMTGHLLAGELRKGGQVDGVVC